MDIKNLESRWIQLFSSNNEPAILKETFLKLVVRYSERHRCYHTLHHVNACLALLDEVADLINDSFNIELALWFHDIIYDPLQNDNEEVSAEYAKACLETMSLNSIEINQIKHLIQLTKHPSTPSTNDEKYLIDIDLSILGAENELFDTYEAWIRKEYSVVPNFLYKKGRKKVLSSFLKSDCIYQTEYFHGKYEIQARQNINRSLHNL